MKVIIAGGRDYLFTNQDINTLDEQARLLPIREVVSGGARGADYCGEQWALERGILVRRFPADWDNTSAPNARIKYSRFGKPYNALAGFARNQQMAEYANVLIAFPGGAGTADMIERMTGMGKPIVLLGSNRHQQGSGTT